ncbi:hypothetical protein CKO42_08140 [Lamprobacter modestohalophilus]|uniref:Uncharacterized protein n=1 Tax=Lamprobacter modestohalophilus TaxID=1064514 RepID=A0A9X0W8U0_9GAMM|nr:hypothetical protein [Lamprobacter modestohalophilus]
MLSEQTTQRELPLQAQTQGLRRQWIIAKRLNEQFGDQRLVIQRQELGLAPRMAEPIAHPDELAHERGGRAIEDTRGIRLIGQLCPGLLEDFSQSAPVRARRGDSVPIDGLVGPHG